MAIQMDGDGFAGSTGPTGNPEDFDVTAARVIFSRLTDRNRTLEAQLATALGRLKGQVEVDAQVEALVRALHDKDDRTKAVEQVSERREAQLRHNIMCLAQELDEARGVIARMARERLPPV